MKQIDGGELMDARIAAVRALVWDRDQAGLRCDLRSALPQRRDLDAIDAIAPRIPLHQGRLVRTIGSCSEYSSPPATSPSCSSSGAIGAQRRGRQLALQVVEQKAIVAILVAELRRRLDEDTALMVTVCDPRQLAARCPSPGP